MASDQATQWPSQVVEIMHMLLDTDLWLIPDTPEAEGGGLVKLRSWGPA